MNNTRSLFTDSSPSEAPPSSSPPSSLLILFGEVESILFRSSTSEFAVLKLAREEGGSFIAVGPLAQLRPGEKVRLNGWWVEDPAHGRQFRVRDGLSLLPDSLVGLERFLASGVVPGIGPILAHRLVATFGEDLWHALDHREEALARTPGLGQARADRLLEVWHRERSRREARVFLVSCGLGLALADRIIDRYREDTITAVKKNPYRLAESVSGIGFLRADEIATHLGIEKDSIERTKAGLRHILREGVAEGHSYLPLRIILRRAEELEMSPANILRAVSRLEEEGKLRTDRERDDDPQSDRAVYSRVLFEAELSVARSIRVIGQRSSFSVPWKSADVLDIVASALKMSLSSSQREAVTQALIAPLLVITGGPGTGKTTIVKAILHLFGVLGIPARLAAPTGRASRRLRETTGAEASTLHRLLEVEGRGMTFRRNLQNPLEAEVVLVDEASMIDLPLFRALLEALPERGRLILVGDANQLPPVGPGNVLEALLASGVVPSVVLDEIHRQASGSLIAFNAQRIIHGHYPRLPSGEESKEADFFFIEETDPEALSELIIDLVFRRLPQHYGLDPVWDLQVLSPSHKGAAGVSALNEGLQCFCSRAKPEAGDGHMGMNTGNAGEEAVPAISNAAPHALPPKGERGQRFQIDDKVLQGRNNYEKELFNGDIGRVLAISNNTTRVLFQDREVELSRSEAGDLELAYAMTVHKAQGSEFPAVIIPLVEGHSAMLRRNLLYTAVTRAKQLVVLVGSPRALKVALRQSASERRFSKLEARLGSQLVR